jgi:hypothetical protein
MVNAQEWLDELGRRVSEQIGDVETFRASSDTLTLALGNRGVTAHDAGDVVWLAPSFAAGGTLASRLQDKVQHLDIQQYGIREATIDVAVDAVLAHLKPAKPDRRSPLGAGYARTAVGSTQALDGLGDVIGRRRIVTAMDQDYVADRAGVTERYLRSLRTSRDLIRDAR